MTQSISIHGVVCMDSWAGRAEKPCRIVGETPKRYRIEVETRTLLPNGWLDPGQQRLVPKTAVRIMPKIEPIALPPD